MAASAPAVLEAGAGSGRLAADLLGELARLGALPDRYAILELSADLRERQRALLAASVPALMPRVEWLDHLPERFSGLVLGNEVLDAMPVHIVAWREDGIRERGVGIGDGDTFAWGERPAGGVLLAAAEEIGRQCRLPPGYESEIGLAARAWCAGWGGRLERGAVLLLDYGFPRREFYHLQRGRGTLMCHYRHHAHPDPFYLPGLQDITAHVDFTAVIAAADGAGLDLIGYAGQGQFLLNCGILDRLAGLPADTPEYIRAAGAVNKLLLPHEMGELFKVIAFGRGIDRPLLGFVRGDQSRRL
jgi:SAM-dependent MidA family methyltransferase